MSMPRTEEVEEMPFVTRSSVVQSGD